MVILASTVNRPQNLRPYRRRSESLTDRLSRRRTVIATLPRWDADVLGGLIPEDVRYLCARAYSLDRAKRRKLEHSEPA